MSSRTIRHLRFGPPVIEIAYFLVDTKMAPADTVPFLEEVDRRWPGLSFRDFLGACVLAEALAMRTEGDA